MKLIVKDILTSMVAVLLFSVVLCGFYPVAVWGAGQLLFPRQANGSLIEGAHGEIVGSTLLGQNFTSPKDFHPRPSAAGAEGYDAANSGGSNLGPTSRKLIAAVQDRVATYRHENGLAPDALAPGDAVTASGSGLDPHISVKNALLQAPRVARERGLPLDVVRSLIATHTAGRQLGLLGEPGVNVLTLNLALNHATVNSH